MDRRVRRNSTFGQVWEGAGLIPPRDRYGPRGGALEQPGGSYLIVTWWVSLSPSVMVTWRKPKQLEQVEEIDVLGHGPLLHEGRGAGLGCHVRKYPAHAIDRRHLTRHEADDDQPVGRFAFGEHRIGHAIGRLQRALRHHGGELDALRPLGTGDRLQRRFICLGRVRRRIVIAGQTIGHRAAAGAVAGALAGACAAAAPAANMIAAAKPSARFLLVISISPVN